MGLQLKNDFPRGPASSGHAAIVSDALSNELHMFSLLSYLTTCGIMDERQLDSIGHARSSYFIHKALVGMQDRTRSRNKGDVDLLYDAALLGGTAFHRNELDAAIAHRQATKFLVDALGGFRAIPPYLVEHILGLDFYVSVSTLSRPLFDYEPSPPPLPWTGNSVLENIGMAIQNTALVNGLDKCVKKLLQDLIQVGQVLECVVSQPESSMNALWVPWKCGTMILALLSSAAKQGDSKLSDKGKQDPEQVPHVASQHTLRPQAPTTEITRLTLIMWAMWLGSIPLSRTGESRIAAKFRDFARFNPRFDSSLLLRYKLAKYGALHDAIEEWNKTLDILAHQRMADDEWIFTRLSNIICTLERGGDVQLGEYMTQLARLHVLRRMVGIKGAEG